MYKERDTKDPTINFKVTEISTVHVSWGTTNIKFDYNHKFYSTDR